MRLREAAHESDSNMSRHQTLLRCPSQAPRNVNGADSMFHVSLTSLRLVE